MAKVYESLGLSQTLGRKRKSEKSVQSDIEMSEGWIRLCNIQCKVASALLAMHDLRDVSF